MSDIFPEIPVWPAQPSVVVEEVIDYQALADHMPYRDETLLLDHAGLLMEEFLWQDYQHRLTGFYETGRWRRWP